MYMTINNFGIVFLILLTLSHLMVIRASYLIIRGDSGGINNIGEESIKRKIGDDNIQEISVSNSSLIRMRRSSWGRMRSMHRLAEERAAVLEERSVWQLGAMVGRYTPYYRTKFVSYGNWCGFGGKGEPVDHCDRCCMVHDLCYDDTIAVADFGCIPYSVPYKYSDVNRKPVCGDVEGRCSHRVCQCDVNFIACLNQRRGCK